MRILVAIPALNEATTIGAVISGIPPVLAGFRSVHILVVDDGSTDHTQQEAYRYGAHVIRHQKTRGLGATFRSAARYALTHGYDAMATIDADGQFRPTELTTLIPPLLAKEADVVTGSRFMPGAHVINMPRVKQLGNRALAWIISRLTQVTLSDVSCGLRVYNHHALLQLTTYHRFTYTHETILDLASKNLAIREVPVTALGKRPCGRSQISHNLLTYGLSTGLIILRFLRDHRPLALASYLSAPLFLAGSGLMLWSLGTRLATNSWIKWAAFSGAAAMALGTAIVLLGFLADMLTRIRKNQEELLLLAREASRIGSNAARISPDTDGVASPRAYDWPPNQSIPRETHCERE